MSETIIQCPGCKAEIPVSELLRSQIREQLESTLRERHQQRLQQAIADAQANAREGIDVELKGLQEQLTAQQQKTKQAQANELTLRKEKELVEQRAKELDLEVARKLDEQRTQLEQSLRQNLAQEQDLKLKEKEKQIDDLRKALEDAKRRSELGSQELQGEVLELDIQSALEQLFPMDRIDPVPKGIRGADIIQQVHNAMNQPCGQIVWETKNTKNWAANWIDKLKEDQRIIGAPLAVLVSVALPEGIDGFAQIDGVWVSSPNSWPTLAAVLREQLIQVAFAHAASEGKQEKMDMLYRYLAGDQFRQKVQGIVEAFTALQEQLNKERRAMERQWKEREKQIERVITNTVGMYGEMSGILGGTLPSIPALELDEELLEER